MRPSFSVKGLLIASGSILFLLLIAWVLYGLYGHRLIEAMYKSDSIELLNNVMAGRKTTPLQDYYEQADYLVITATLGLPLLFLVVVLFIGLIKKPVEIVLACSSFIIFSFLLFSVIEVFPSLITPLHLNRLAYYGEEVSKIPDDMLGYRYRPGMRIVIPGVRSALYSPLYGVEVPPRTLKWVTNKDGFRAESDEEFADVVLIGDSFIEFGDSEAQTFGKRLEQKLGGWTVANLGISGYGPFQYLEVLKRYGIKKKPKVVFFCFYEGNDIYGIQEYLKWKEDGAALSGYKLTSKNWLHRYRILAGEIVGEIQDSMWTAAKLILNKITQAQYIHPDLVILRFENGDTHKVLLLDKHSALSTEEMLRTDDWQTLRQILIEGRTVTVEHGFTPMILHIPMTASIYAEYSTEESGTHWREVRDAQVARKENMENAMLSLSREVGMELVNLSPIFRLKAKQGHLLYEPIDTHWNLYGREVAAQYVAEQLMRLPLNRAEHVLSSGKGKNVGAVSAEPNGQNS